MTTKSIDPRIFEQFNARAPFKLEDATILLFAQVGSHSHNTYIPKDNPQAIDDTDYMAVIVPPVDYTLGMRNWENVDFIHEELDCVFYSFRKFVNLLAKGNPNVLGLLYLRNRNNMIEHSIWRDIILEHKDAFINKKLTFCSFIGYSKEQFKKMTHFDLNTQEKWNRALEIIEAAGWTKEQITRGQHRDMPNVEAVKNVLRKTYKEDFLVDWFITNELEAAAADIKLIHARHFQGYMGEKRKALVQKFGYDTKNAAHLIRLMRMCNEYLQTGELKVWRDTDADEIKSIKSGKWALEQVKKEAEALFAEAEILYLSSTLPELPNMDAINNICIDVYLSAYNLSHPAYAG